MTKIMPVPRKLRITVLPAGGIWGAFFVRRRGVQPIQNSAIFFVRMAVGVEKRARNLEFCELTDREALW